MEWYRSGQLIHGYRVNPKARNIHEFDEVIRNSFDPESTFMNALLLTRMEKETWIEIHNWNITESRGRVPKTQMIDSKEQLVTAIGKHFGIPETIVLDSIEGLPMHNNGFT